MRAPTVETLQRSSPVSRLAARMPVARGCEMLLLADQRFGELQDVAGHSPLSISTDAVWTAGELGRYLEFDAAATLDVDGVNGVSRANGCLAMIMRLRVEGDLFTWGDKMSLVAEADGTLVFTLGATPDPISLTRTSGWDVDTWVNVVCVWGSGVDMYRNGFPLTGIAPALTYTPTNADTDPIVIGGGAEFDLALCGLWFSGAGLAITRGIMDGTLVPAEAFEAGGG